MHSTPTQEFGPDADEDGKTALEAVRAFKGMSVEALAERSGVSAAGIRGAEGGRELSLEAQLKLAAALGVGADMFVE